MATSNKKEKRLARERQALTGEPYTVALVHVRQTRPDVSDKKTDPDISDALWNELLEASKRQLRLPADLEHLEPGDLDDILDVCSVEPTEFEDYRLPNYPHYPVPKGPDFSDPSPAKGVTLLFLGVGAAILDPGQEKSMLGSFHDQIGIARVVHVLLEGTVPVEVLSVHVLKKVDSKDRWSAMEDGTFESSERWAEHLSLGIPKDERVLSSNSWRDGKFKLEIRYSEPVSIDLSNGVGEWKMCVRLKSSLAEPGSEKQGIVSGLVAYSIDQK
jgi:hypothetical protein